MDTNKSLCTNCTTTDVFSRMGTNILKQVFIQHKERFCMLDTMDAHDTKKYAINADAMAKM